MNNTNGSTNGNKMTLNITVIGNAVDSAVYRTTDTGAKVLNFTIARNERKTKKVVYVDCSVWGGLAESLNGYISKGKQIYIEGELGHKEWKGRVTYTCRARNIELLGGGAYSDKKNEHDEDHGVTPPSSGQNNQKDLDDEIPF